MIKRNNRVTSFFMTFISGTLWVILLGMDLPPDAVTKYLAAIYSNYKVNADLMYVIIQVYWKFDFFLNLWSLVMPNGNV